MRTIEATIVMRAILIARFRAFVRSCESRARVGGDAMGAGGDRWKGFSPRGGRGCRRRRRRGRRASARDEDED